MKVGDVVKTRASYTFIYRKSIKGIVKEITKKYDSNTFFVTIIITEYSGSHNYLGKEVTLLKNDLVVIDWKK